MTMKLHEAFAKKTYKPKEQWLREYGEEIAKKIYESTNFELSDYPFEPFEFIRNAEADVDLLRVYIRSELKRLYREAAEQMN